MTTGPARLIPPNQVFSLSYGSVTDELNMKSRAGRNGWQNTVVKVSEEGAKFRSYRDGRLINLTPELSVQASPRAPAQTSPRDAGDPRAPRRRRA